MEKLKTTRLVAALGTHSNIGSIRTFPTIPQVYSTGDTTVYFFTDAQAV